MKNYKLWKFRILKTGFVFGVNKFDWIWVEFWVKGKVKTVRLDNLFQFEDETRTEWEQNYYIL